MNSQSDPMNEKALEAEFGELSKTKRSLIILSIICIVALLIWITKTYSTFSPQSKQLKFNYEPDSKASSLQLLTTKEDTEELHPNNAETDKPQTPPTEKETTATKPPIEQSPEQPIKQPSLIDQHKLACETAIKEKNWSIAEEHLTQLHQTIIKETELAELQAQIKQGKEQEATDIKEVKRLIAEAQKLNTGTYSEEAIQFLDTALKLKPKHTEALALRETINSYNSEFHIPKDAPSISEIIPKLRAGDTIILAPGKHQLSATFDKPITIKGSGLNETIIEWDTSQSPLFVFQNSEEDTSNLSDLTLTGIPNQDPNKDRYPLILIHGNTVINNIKVKQSSSHGIAITSGTLILQNSAITENSWSGINVHGSEAIAHISKCSIFSNYDHGIDYWQAARGSIKESEIHQNSGSGVVVMGEGSSIQVTRTRSYKNGQCGVVALDKSTLELDRVVAASNILSGVVIQGKETNVIFNKVVSNNNKEAGFYLDPASAIKGQESIQSKSNAKGNLISKALEHFPETNTKENH